MPGIIPFSRRRRAAALCLALLSQSAAAPPHPLAAVSRAKIIREGAIRPPSKLPAQMQGSADNPQPWIIRMLIQEFSRGMFICLPIIDTNPNKGTTYGVMPIVVLQGKDNKRIEHIFAPSLTYNPTFFWEPTWRYYYYPTDHASYFLRAALSGNQNKDIIGKMEDLDFLGRGIALSARLAFDVDGTKRFFGIGRASDHDHETNFLRKTLSYFARVGVPIFTGSDWKFNLAHHLAGEKITGGAMPKLTSIRERFPDYVPESWHQDSEIQLFIDYDTRDNAATTTTGSYLKFMIENSQKDFASEFSFQRYGIDMRRFYKHRDDARLVSAGRFRFEQLIGDAPFYLLPSLGGKDTHRAYGKGRYIDNGMLTATLEERFIVYKAEVAGATTEVEIAPFFGMGTVFSAPKRIARRYLRPVFGTAFRAITRPQVVGSVDLGVGQEGASVFMDINYSF